MRLILAAILLCSAAIAEDIPPIPAHADAAGWDRALQPGEERLDPFLFKVAPPRAVTEGISATFLESGLNHKFTLFQTPAGSILFAGYVDCGANHVFVAAEGLRVIVLDFGTVLETRTGLHFIPK